MTVAELIKELEKMPQDYSVVFFIDNDECFPPKYDVDEVDINLRNKTIELYQLWQQRNS